jgi:hypothetical protein
METENTRGDRSQPDTVRWQIAGHEVIFDRGTFRHKAYRKDFPKGTIVKRDGVPFITSAGKVLKTDDIFPERADLALDSDANIIPQHQFDRNYKQFLGWYTWIESTDINVEPIPSVEDYVSQTYDTFSESKGFVTIGYDAKKLPEQVRTHQYDPNTDKLVEIAATQAVMTDALKHLLEENLKPKRGPGRPPKVRDEEEEAA